MLKKNRPTYGLTSKQHTLIALFQNEVDRVIPTGYVCQGYEIIQAAAKQLVNQYTADLSNGFDSNMALKIARLELYTIKRNVHIQTRLLQNAQVSRTTRADR